MERSTTTTSIGKTAEQIAELYLNENGLSLLDRNFRHKSGEIDLIMLDGNVLVFVEVRYRKNKHWMDPVETVNIKKCKRIIKTSLYFLQRNKHYAEQTCRFDVIIINGKYSDQEIEWIKNAFQA